MTKFDPYENDFGERSQTLLKNSIILVKISTTRDWVSNRPKADSRPVHCKKADFYAKLNSLSNETSFMLVSTIIKKLQPILLLSDFLKCNI